MITVRLDTSPVGKGHTSVGPNNPSVGDQYICNELIAAKLLIKQLLDQLDAQRKELLALKAQAEKVPDEKASN